MKIRSATRNDKEKVLKLFDEMDELICKKDNLPPDFKPPTSKLGGEIFDEIISRKDAHILVAEDTRGEIVGQVELYLIPDIRHGQPYCRIEEFFVTAGKRGQGVGTSLLNTVKAFCRKNDIKIIRLHSGLNLTDAHRFYEKNGGKFSHKSFRLTVE